MHTHGVSGLQHAFYSDMNIQIYVLGVLGTSHTKLIGVWGTSHTESLFHELFPFALSLTACAAGNQ
jgi:hypothetical protein